ncbi:rhodanese-like domain-containing protein [Bdellovibrio sp. BCCA]|uniref:rhodanese-like domain-containing protein n=1 Tax=unclassified Bdellovibrio TaxID=2633795 RepID=UPI0025D86304|nr:rhodanese-like domain-containing protein [uncultured Bdellovibrio sp.]
MEFNSIGFFQFDNLLRNRVPLLLVMLEEVNLKPWYDSVVQMHIQNATISCTSKEEALKLIQDKKLPAHFGIVVLDQKGDKSPTVVAELEKVGFTNAFYVKNGFVGISEERNQN